MTEPSPEPSTPSADTGQVVSADVFERLLATLRLAELAVLEARLAGRSGE